MTSITPEQIAEWRSYQDKGMISALGEYTPDEFWQLLDAYEARTAIELQSAATAKLLRVLDAANQMNGLVCLGGPAGRYQGELKLAVAAALDDPSIATLKA